MARVRQFDTDEVLLQAMGVFREKGYENASIQDLVEATGLGRGSLYAAFESKANLYRLVLKRYVGQVGEVMRGQLVARMPVRESLRQLLIGRVDDVLEVPGRPGCLLVNAIVDHSARDDATRRIAEDALAAVREMLAATLHTARGIGELPGDADVERLANFFVMVIQGLRVMGTIESDRNALTAVVDTVLDVLPHQVEA